MEESVIKRILAIDEIDNSGIEVCTGDNIEIIVLPIDVEVSE